MLVILRYTIFRMKLTVLMLLRFEGIEVGGLKIDVAEMSRRKIRLTKPFFFFMFFLSFEEIILIDRMKRKVIMKLLHVCNFFFFFAETTISSAVILMIILFKHVILILK